METAYTSWRISIDIAKNWQWHWAQMWSDLGRLVDAHANDLHIGKHNGGPWCSCWECRVIMAWEKRYAQPEQAEEE